MTPCTQIISHDRNLYYIHQHKRAFQSENYFYPLDLFENFVEKADNWALECSCKIEKELLYPIRFNLFRPNPNLSDYRLVCAFFAQVEKQVGIELNYQLLKDFCGNDFDFSKVVKIGMGVDLRPDFSKSRLKVWFWINDYVEKLEQAIVLAGDREDLRALYIRSFWLVGFDFHLNGHSIIELYPGIERAELMKPDIRLKVEQVLSPSASKLLNAFKVVLIGFSQNNPDRLIYGYLTNPNDFIPTLNNDLANQIHAYYQQQSALYTMVCLSEKELQSGLIQNLNLYYQMT